MRLARRLDRWEAVWTRWRSAAVDYYRPLRSSSHWLDETVIHQQVRDLITAALTFTADEANRAALTLAVAYYVAANVDVHVELAVAIPVPALQLLAFYRFVSQRKTHSQRAWKELTTEHQLRLLLADVKLDTRLPPHFRHLMDVSNRLALSGQQRDALGTIIKMRNVVTHPTRDRPADFTVYEWAEAGMLVRYWLCLALLNTVAYQGKIAVVLEGQPSVPGHLQTPPWMQ